MTTCIANRQRQGCVARLACFPFSLCLSALLLSGDARRAQAQAPRQPVSDDPPVARTASEAEPSNEAPGRFALPQIEPTRHEISISGDYFYGQGNVTLPVFFSLVNSPVGTNLTPYVAKPDRKSDYFGATLSYSLGQAWYFDASYAHGFSSGNLDVDFPGVPPHSPETRTRFEIEDDRYQAYVRYTFPRLRGKRLSAYLRAGASFVESDLSDEGNPSSFFGQYEQTDRTRDILGNLGSGLGYTLYSGSRTRVGLQLEGEAFYGHRSQESQETLPRIFPPIVGPSTRIDNELYGGLGRSTVRFEYALGQRGVLRLSAEVSMEVRYTQIHYSDFDLGTHDELLWGPYAKLGLRYSF